MSRGRSCPHGHALPTGCGVCRREHVVAVVAAADPSLSVAQVTAAVAAAVPNGAALRSLTVALAEGPEVLHIGAPPAVGRLVAALVAAGSVTFVASACVTCGRGDRPLTRSPLGGVCPRCRHRQSATACAHCGVTKPVAGRTDAGTPICEACRRHHRGQRRCGVCAQVGAIARRARDGQPDVCVNCYRLPHATCHRCSQSKPCNYADSPQPICKTCTPRTTTRCAHCGRDRPATARWPEGPVCEPCYRVTLQRRGICAGCQQPRRLIAPAGPEATRCADCADVTLPGGHVCGDCGTEERLFERGRCARCTLARRTQELLSDGGGDIPVALAGVAAAIIAAPQPYSALNWVRKGAGATILADLAAGRLDVTHEALDSHPRPHAAAYLRRMLTAHGVLEERNEELIGAQRWVTDLLATIQRPTDRNLVAAYASWRVLRRLRRRAQHSPGPWTATRHTKTYLTATVGLLDYLAGRGLTVSDAGQRDIDAWLATSPSAHEVGDFLTWAGEHGHCQPLTVPLITSRTGPALDPELRWELLARLLHDDTIDLTDRVAGCLVLCYAQQLSRITALTTDQVTRGATTTIRFGAHPLNLPEPLAGLVCAHIDTPRSHVGIGAPATSRWLFPGHHPGRPLSPAQLGTRLRRLGIPTMASRRATLLHLAAALPAAVLADLLNLSVGTAVGWVNTAGGDYNRYAAALAHNAITDHSE